MANQASRIRSRPAIFHLLATVALLAGCRLDGGAGCPPAGPASNNPPPLPAPSSVGQAPGMDGQRCSPMVAGEDQAASGNANQSCCGTCTAAENAPLADKARLPP